MSIADYISDAMPMLRAQAESLMVTPCRVLRPTGKTFDPVTNTETATADLIHEGVCQIRSRDVQVTFAESASGLVQAQQNMIKLPVQVGPVLDGDLIQTLVDGTPDRTFWVADRSDKTWQTAQRLPVQEIPTAPVTVT